MLDAQFNPPFEAEEFVGKLDEFIKDADQCKEESHTKEDNRKEEGKEEKEDSSKTKEKKPYGLLENFDKFWKLLMDKEAYE
jgi:hypothetical protein